MALDDEMIVAIATAAISEEAGISATHLRVISFSEIQKSSLEKYIEENGIIYNKFELDR